MSRESPSVRYFPPWLRDWLPEIVLLLVTTGAGLWAAGRWLDPSGDAGYFWSLAYERRPVKRLDESQPDLVVLLKRYVKDLGSAPFGEGYGLLLADWCSRNYQVIDSSHAGRILRKRRKDPQR